MVLVSAQVVLLLALRPRLEPILAPVCVKQSPLQTYLDLMRLVEQHTFADERLRALQRQLREPTVASEQMRRLERLLGLASVRHNALVHVLADVFLMWDVWCAYLLDRWRARHGARVADWLEALSEMEALGSIATFAREHPTYAWPRVTDGATRFATRTLGHPLIAPERRVDNDVELGGAVFAVLITGSNMSGKSTMLRSMGVAAVLAQAGAPVCATELGMSPLRVFTSMRVGDALDRGVSRFYMEVEKLKRIVDALDEPGPPVFFLLDEVLHGTNSRERNIGAKAVVRHIVERGAIGAVSSHDLGLVELEELTEGKVKNVHFEDHIQEGRSTTA
jgi:DNA mismatch repair ATPase MutS